LLQQRSRAIEAYLHILAASIAITIGSIGIHQSHSYTTHTRHPSTIRHCSISPFFGGFCPMHYSHGGATCISFDIRIYPPSFLHYILVRLIGTVPICSTYVRFSNTALSLFRSAQTFHSFTVALSRYLAIHRCSRRHT